MSMIKSKKHIGVYQKLLENGDISYYYNYKDVDGVNGGVKIGSMKAA